MPFDTTCPTAFASLKSFLSAHHSQLRSAAALLSGDEAARRTSRLVFSVLEAPSLTARHRRELGWLWGLLTIQNVSDFGTDEAECFAMIDPASPVVEEICLLSDGLRTEMLNRDL